MNPKLTKSFTEDNTYNFTLTNINVSLANSLRRIILSEIPTTVFKAEDITLNNCKIVANTSRLHNEIIKQRLCCIPIHIKNTDELPNKYILEIDVENDTDNIAYITTEHFKIKNKANENYMTEDEVHKIFPKNVITQSYIDFVRLRPRIADSIPGERLKLSCEFSVGTAKENSMYNVVSKCAYSNTIDPKAVDDEWEKRKQKYAKEGTLDEAEIEYEKKNFYILDAQRHFVPDSFDFVIESVGVYENKYIIKNACKILQNKFVDFIQNIDSNTIPIHASNTMMENAFDIVLENEDYTMGKVLEYLLFALYYDVTDQKNKILLYCGFLKEHPHDTDSIIRVQLPTEYDKTTVKQTLRDVAIVANDIYKKLYTMF